MTSERCFDDITAQLFTRQIIGVFAKFWSLYILVALYFSNHRNVID